METHYDPSVTRPRIGQIMSRRATRRARAELHVHRSSGPVDVLPVEEIEAAKAAALILLADDEDVFRVDLHDPMRGPVWSTDDAWRPRRTGGPVEPTRAV